MTDKIAEIRARHKLDSIMSADLQFSERHWTNTQEGWVAHNDRATLLAEVKRLTARNKRLHRALFRIAGKAPFADDPWTIATKAINREAKS